MTDLRKNLNATPLKRVRTVTADTTFTILGLPDYIDTTGAAGAVTVTLPDPTAQLKGREVVVLNAVDQSLTVRAVSADKLASDNDVAVTSVAYSTASHKAGNSFTLRCNGTLWFVQASNLANVTAA